MGHGESFIPIKRMRGWVKQLVVLNRASGMTEPDFQAHGSAYHMTVIHWLNMSLLMLSQSQGFFHGGTVQVQSLSNRSRSQPSENTKTVQLDDDPDDDVWMGGLTSHGQIVRWHCLPCEKSAWCLADYLPVMVDFGKRNTSWNRRFSQRSKENNKKWFAALAPRSSLRVLVLNHPISRGGNCGNWLFTLSNIK